MDTRTGTIGSSRTLSRPTTHRCHADDCKAECPRHAAFCDEHTKMLPVWLRQKIWRLFDPCDVVCGDYLDAIEYACCLIRSREAADRAKRGLPQAS